MEFLQFAFRWVNCLLARELPFQLAVRLWDTYLAEGPRMKEFLIYVLASFVLSWSAELSRMEFQVQQLILCLALKCLKTHFSSTVAVFPILWCLVALMCEASTFPVWPCYCSTHPWSHMSKSKGEEGERRRGGGGVANAPWTKGSVLYNASGH